MKKNRLKFNTLDACIVILLVFIVLGTFIRSHIKSTNILDSNKKEVTIYIDVTDKSKSLSKSVNIGDSVKLKGSRIILGEISGVVNRNNKKYVPDEDKFEIVYTDDLYNVLIKFDAVVYENENGLFTRDNNYLAPGSDFEFETQNAVFHGTINRIIEK